MLDERGWLEGMMNLNKIRLSLWELRMEGLVLLLKAEVFLFGDKEWEMNDNFKSNTFSPTLKVS